MRRLIRESNPPSGQLASPVPQYWNPNTEDFEDVLGDHGAPRSILYGPNGQPISQSNPLEVRVRELEADLAAIRGMFETGDAKVTLTGSLPSFANTPEVSLVGSKALNAVPVVPDDSNDLPDGVTEGLYVGTSGKVTVLLENASSPVTFLNLASGGIHPMRVKRVYATDTDALNIVAVY